MFITTDAVYCNKDREKFENIFPENPIKLQCSLTLIENVTHTNECRTARKRKVSENKEI